MSRSSHSRTGLQMSMPGYWLGMTELHVPAPINPCPGGSSAPEEISQGSLTS